MTASDGDPLLDRLREALEHEARPIPYEGVARHIAGRTPRALADASRARGLRGAALAAAVVLAALFAFEPSPSPAGRDGTRTSSRVSFGAADALPAREAPSPLVRLAAPTLALADDESVDEPTLLDEVVFGALR